MSKTLIILILINFTVVRPQDDKVKMKNGDVLTTSGILRGTGSRRYFTYLGIPYAQPPIGNLRFRAPLPHPGWEGIRKAIKLGNSCPTSNPNPLEKYSEDCLFLNIYKNNNFVRVRRGEPPQLMPVMVFFNGGNFPSLPRNKFIFEFDDLLEEKVIVVTLNYRLEALGFLSTGDNNAPGNYGLKDAVLALKWIRENIGAFGGDRNRTTIFGQGMGGAHVHYLVLSPAAKGLFNGAISQSGTALNPWAYQTNPLDEIRPYSKQCNITYIHNSDFVRQLREVDLKVLMKAIPTFMEYSIPRGHQPFPFVPSKDPRGVSSEEMFLPDDPLQLIQSGSFNQVPYIVGFNNAESLFTLQELRMDPLVFSTLNKNPNLFIPKSWDVPLTSSTEADAIRQIQDFYFNHNCALNNHFGYNFTQYNTDLLFARGIDQTARLHGAIHSPANPVYYYQFNFVGKLNVMKSLIELDNYADYPGAAHGDELFYLFKIRNAPNTPFQSLGASRMQKLMIRMWTNFARLANPTPTKDSIAKINWYRVGIGKQRFLSIDKKILMSDNPFGDRMKFWNELQAKCNTSTQL